MQRLGTFIQTLLVSTVLGAMSLESAMAAQLPRLHFIGHQRVKGVNQVGTNAQVLRTDIMCIGDSNTHGVQGHPSWRYPLWFRLYPLQHVIDFVGTRFTVHQEDGVTIPNLTSYNRYYTHFDRDHQAYNGFRTDQIVPWLPQAIATTRPDMCIIMAGTNDIGQMGFAGIQNALDGIEDMVNTVRAQAPATTFLITTLPPIGQGSGYSGNQQHVVPFNAQLAALVSSMNKPVSRVELVDVHSVLDVGLDMLPDGLHPNQAGQVKVANVIYMKAIQVIQGMFRPVHEPTIQIQDTGFEILGLADGMFSASPLSHWEYPNSLNITAGVWNPDEISYTGAALNGTPANADGDEVLAIENSGGGPDLAWVSQTFTTTLEANKEYTLTLAVGNRAPTNSRLTTDYGGYEVQILAGNRIIQSSLNQVSPAPGTFLTDTLFVDTKNVHHSLLGSPLTVRFRLTWSDPNSATDFDAINLTVL